jgi:hypothetical protein
MKILVFALFIAAPALAAPLCEPVINSRNPRRVDIQFPGKTVTVVGHQHPRRNDETPGLEDTLINILTGATKTETPQEIREARESLDRFLKSDARALQHWREDLQTLEEEVREHNVTIGYSEQDRAYKRQLDPWADHFVRNGPAVLQKLGYTKTQAEELVVVSLSPSLYFQFKHPEIPFYATTAEPSERQYEEYTKLHCPPKKDVEEDLKETTDALAAKLKARGLSEKLIANRFELGMKAFAAEFEKDIEQKLTVESSQRLFLNGAGMTFTPGEKALIQEFFVKFLADRPKGVDPESLEKNLAENIKNYDGCWGRDALMARYQARARGNSILFVGIGHLAPQAALLKRECLKMLQPPAAMPVNPTTAR